MALPFDERPLDATPRHTPDLPDTPQRDRRIPARAWIEAPAELLGLGEDFGGGEAGFIRRIHGWLLWRSGPPAGGDAQYLAIAGDSLDVQYAFRLDREGSGEGAGPSGTVHERFRAWKEDLRDHPRSNAGDSQA
ncbi:MAG TPA: hypothetical protein VM388_07305 [Acidimicrobiales bacterium]|jgi:hypothetical protein|nr:hypothetical protein [Acidimicrobiales bacterium]HWI05685.1 hypothetical protein [Acidimicrobiales bacterium]